MGLHGGNFKLQVRKPARLNAPVGFLQCVNEIERLCQAWGRKETVKRKNDFKRGAARGVADKVKAERDQVLREEEARASAHHHSSRALQWFERKELAARE